MVNSRENSLSATGNFLGSYPYLPQCFERLICHLINFLALSATPIHFRSLWTHMHDILEFQWKVETTHYVFYPLPSYSIILDRWLWRRGDLSCSWEEGRCSWPSKGGRPGTHAKVRHRRCLKSGRTTRSTGFGSAPRPCLRPQCTPTMNQLMAACHRGEEQNGLFQSHLTATNSKFNGSAWQKTRGS